MVQWDHFFLPHKMFVCQTKTCWEITNWILSKPPSVPQLLSSTARTAMFRGLRGHSPPWGLYNSPVSLPPSHLGYHLCDWKQVPLRGAGDGAGRLPPQWTEISVMSQIWQTRSLYGGLALLWAGNSGGINSKLTQWTALRHMKPLPESLVGSKSGWKHRRSHAANLSVQLSDRYAVWPFWYLSSTFDMTNVTAVEKHTSVFLSALLLIPSTACQCFTHFIDIEAPELTAAETHECFSGWYTWFQLGLVVNSNRPVLLKSDGCVCPQELTALHIRKWSKVSSRAVMAAVVESFAVKQISDVVAAAFSGGPQVSPRLVMFVKSEVFKEDFLALCFVLFDLHVQTPKIQRKSANPQWKLQIFSICLDKVPLALN